MTPPATAPEQVPRADAVVMFAGGRGERLALALKLVQAGRAPVLVIPNGTAPQWAAANDLCTGHDNPKTPTGLADIEVICPRPSPSTTRGESRAIARLARERGWDSLIAVTSTYHLRRAELLLDRCFNGTMVGVAANPAIGALSSIRVVVHEWGGHLQARVLRRSC